MSKLYRGTPYFVATSLFDNPFSRSFKALHFSAKDLFVSFRFTGTIFLKKTSDEKLKTFVMYFLTKKFRILAKMLKRKFERTRGNHPRVQQFCLTYRDIRDIESFFCPKKCVMFKALNNLLEVSKRSRNWVFEFSRVNYMHRRMCCSLFLRKLQVFRTVTRLIFYSQTYDFIFL